MLPAGKGKGGGGGAEPPLVMFVHFILYFGRSLVEGACPWARSIMGGSDAVSTLVSACVLAVGPFDCHCLINVGSFISLLPEECGGVGFQAPNGVGGGTLTSACSLDAMCTLPMNHD